MNDQSSFSENRPPARPDDLWAVPLRDYFERMIQDQGRRIDQALTASREAVDKAEKAQERRLDLLNEFRAQSQDEQAKFALRELMDERLQKIERSISIAQGGVLVVAFVGLANLIRIWTG